MSDIAIAREIARQLGSQTLALLGATQLVGGENFLQFKIKGCRKINCIKIVLDANDTYTVEFWKVNARTDEVVKVSEHEGIYFDMLHDLIERHTGLYTTFHARS
jgi:hypothetical protein